MSNIEEFEKLTKAINDSLVTHETVQNTFLCCIASYLAQIADVFNEIKEEDNK